MPARRSSSRSSAIAKLRDVFIALVAAVAGGAAVHTYHRVRPLFEGVASPSPAAIVSRPASGVAPAAPRAPEPPGSDIDRLRSRAPLFPVEGVDALAITDTYNQARGGRIHEALDILAPRGTPVLAVDDGRIEKLFTSERGGLTVYQFDPTETYCYYYAHLDRYEPGLLEKQIVRKGERLGYVGTTGNAATTAPHLHLALFKLNADKRWWEGTPLNPYPLWR